MIEEESIMMKTAEMLREVQERLKIKINNVQYTFLKLVQKMKSLKY